MTARRTRRFRIRVRLIALTLLSGCGGPSAAPLTRAADEPAPVSRYPASAYPTSPYHWEAGPRLAEAVSNQAVAAVEVDGACRLYSFLGIGRGRDQTNITNAAQRWDDGADTFVRIADAPGPPRLAASAVTVRGRVYLVGGYTVAPDGAEASLDRVDVLDPRQDTWSSAAPVPIPIDDAVVAAWRDRWIVVVSGWSNTANRAETQLYDVETGRWSLATPFPGTPAFGHAGGIAGDTLVVIDGVRDRPFTMIEESWRATLNPEQPNEIQWEMLPQHPGPPRYRAAAGASPEGRLLFAGGTDQPYNFDGLTYVGERPAPPIESLLVYHPSGSTFTLETPAHPSPAMDHRGLITCRDRLYTVGGMVAGPVVTDATFVLR